MVLSIQHSSNSANREVSDRSNQLIDLFPKESQNSISSSDRVVLPAKKIIYQPDEVIQKVYFPIKGIVSLTNVGNDGEMVEFATIGREGAIGLAALFGVKQPNSLAIAQTDCIALGLPLSFLKREFERSGEVRRILLLYSQALLFQVAQNVYCSCHHVLEQRLARWLLAYSDRLETRKISLTQETLADLLGVRRASLSVIASDLRNRKLIKYNRGKITICDREGLRMVACKCDRLISAEYARLFDIA